MKNYRSSVQYKRMVNQQKAFNSSRGKMCYMETRLSDISKKKGSSSWLTVLSMTGIQFVESRILRCSTLEVYRVLLKRLQSHCGYSQSIYYAQSRFVTIRQRSTRKYCRNIRRINLRCKSRTDVATINRSRTARESFR